MPKRKNPTVAYTKQGKPISLKKARKLSYEKRRNITFFNWKKINKKKRR